jgi:hypothetical protein
MGRLIPIAFWVFVLGFALLIGWTDWSIYVARQDGQLSRANAWIGAFQLLLGFLATVAGMVGAWYTFFTPFYPKVTVGPYTWRVRPDGSPNIPVEIVLWLSVANEGARPGVVQDLIATVSLPKGDWLLTPMFLVDSAAYLKGLMNPQDSPNLPAVEPFTPIPLPGKAQIAKGVLFAPFEGKANRGLLEAGTHKVSFYVDFGGGDVRHAAERKIVIEPDMVAQWRAGTTIAGTQFQRDRPFEDLLRELGIKLRLGQ